MMSLIIIFSFVLTFSKFIQCYQISGKCGFPGLPHDTQIEPQKKTVYEEGEEVRYSCPGDKLYVKTQVKKCVRGEWVGPRSTCGNFIRNQIIRVKVIDLENNQTIIDKDSSKITDDEYPVSYYDVKGTQIVVEKPHKPHKWFFQFENPVLFDFFLLNMRTPRSSQVIDIDGIRVRNVVVLNEDNRTCSLDFKTRQNKYAKVFWFWCTESKVKEDSQNENLTISFITYSDQEMKSVGLHQVYLTKLKYCGHPPIPLFAKYLPNIEEGHQIVCDPEVSVDIKTIDNSSDLALPNSMNEDYSDCIDNQYWAGNPKCVPKVFCKLNHNETSETIVSVKNAYILKDEEWMAIDGTIVHFKCNPGFEFAGDSVRTCIACPQCVNATWDQPGPICHSIFRQPVSSSLTPGTVLGIALTVAFVVIVAIVIAVLIVIKLRRNVSQNISNKTPKDFNLYEDIQQTGTELYADYNYGTNYDNYTKPDYEGKGYEEARYEVEQPRMLKDNYYLGLNQSRDDDQNYNEDNYDDCKTDNKNEANIGKETSV